MKPNQQGSTQHDKRPIEMVRETDFLLPVPDPDKSSDDEFLDEELLQYLTDDSWPSAEPGDFIEYSPLDFDVRSSVDKMPEDERRQYLSTDFSPRVEWIDGMPRITYHILTKSGRIFRKTAGAEDPNDKDKNANKPLFTFSSDLVVSY